MDVLVEWLPRIGASLTLIIGLVGFFRPQLIAASQHIHLEHPVALSEARVALGGIHLGYSIVALALHEPIIYIAIGMGWLMGVLARFWSMFADKTSLAQSAGGLVVDGVLALLLLSGLILG